MYELWDTETGNRVGSFRTEDAALDDVRDAIKTHGETSPEVQNLGLIKVSGRGAFRDEAIAQGTALVDLAVLAGVR